MPDLSVILSPSFKLKNPVLTASGTCGYGTEEDYPYNPNLLGAFVCKGTTLLPRPGNPQPRLAETPSGLLNAIGLENIGIEALLKDKAPVWASWQTPVVVNIAADSIQDYADLARRLDKTPGITAVEINISCPNVKAGCIEFGSSPESAAQVTDAVRTSTSLPIIVKLTPNTSDIVALAKSVVNAGADAVSLINTLRGMAIDLKRRRPFLGNITGGLSGPAVKPVALAMVYRVSQAIDKPVIGIGGIASTEDALEFIMAGASAVQVGTAALVNPLLPVKIIDGLAKYLEVNHIDSIRSLIGAAWR